METKSGLMPVMDLLNEAYKLTEKKAKVLYSIAGVLYGLVIVAVIFGVLGAFGVMYFSGTVRSLPTSLVGILVALIVFLIVLIISFWVQVALYEAVINEFDFKQSFAAAKNKIGVYFGTAFLTGLIVLGGFILLIVPGFIFMVWYAFATIIVIAEGLKYTAAIKQSKSYVTGRWGAVAGRILVYVLIVGLLQGIISGVFGTHNPLRGIVSTIVNFIMLPFSISYTYLLYKNLRDTKLAPVSSSPAPVEVTPTNG